MSKMITHIFILSSPGTRNPRPARAGGLSPETRLRLLTARLLDVRFGLGLGCLRRRGTSFIFQAGLKSGQFLLGFTHSALSLLDLLGRG